MKAIPDKQVNIGFLITNFITQFLFFIDEGYNDFRWMKQPGNWLVYLIYISVIFGVLFGMLHLLALVRKGVRFICVALIKS